MPRFLVLSDLHLGAHRGVHHVGVGLQAAAVMQKARLDKSADVVVLNGDIFDNWAHPIDAVPPTWKDLMKGNEVEQFLGEIAKWDAGSVWYIKGNHDFDVPSIKPCVMFTAGTAYQELWFEHGHRMDMFNAPDPTGRYYPFGYFITRVHTQGLHTKAPALREAHYYFKGFDRAADKAKDQPVADVLREVSLVDIVMRAVALDAGVQMSDKILMPDGTSPTVQEVTDTYQNLFIEWANQIGFQTASQMLAVSVERMEWEAQEVLKGAHKRILAMGHSHKPEYHYYDGIGGYVNDGAMCIGVPTWTRITYPDSGTDAVCIEQHAWSSGIVPPVSTTWVKL